MPVATHGDQSLCFDNGRIAYTRYLDTRRDIPPNKSTEQNVAFLYNNHSPAKTWSSIMADARAVTASRLGFQLARVNAQEKPLQLSADDTVHTRTHIFLLIVPFWSLTLAFALLPTRYVLQFVRHLRRKHRERHHRCPACGYDLRESPDQCPECGHTVAPVALRL